MGNKIRAFIATPIPDIIRDRIIQVQVEMKKNVGKAVRWVQPEGIHLTFHFLGSIDQREVSKIADMIGEVCSHTRIFSVRVRGLGAFPDLRRARVFWVGVERNEALVNLHRNLGKGLEKLGYEIEKRSFHPHLTLGRTKDFTGITPIVEEMELRRDMELGEFEVREVVLFQSVLTPRGAIYSRISTQNLSKS